jgi:hypothetical protein
METGCVYVVEASPFKKDNYGFRSMPKKRKIKFGDLIYEYF